MKRIVISVGLIWALMIGSVSSANSITFGREVTNAASAYPSVVSIWHTENSEDEPEFLCTGTLIQLRVVLTAAHCVLSTGIYFVKYGADQLDDDTELLSVSATWRNPRFSASQLVNDTGLLLLEEEIPGASITRLPSSAEIVKMQTSKSVKYEIVGWGKDQNDEPASYLRKAAVEDQTQIMKKFKWWKNDVWFAVGKYNKKEKVYAGACNGDSGGPLFASVGSKKLLVGVTSWGAEDCETRAPSIYVRLSYYIDTLLNVGLPALEINEVKQNRALPSVISEPSISGTPLPGSMIECSQGTWSENTQSVSISWSGPGVPYGTTSSSITLSKVNQDSVYECVVTATNDNGATTRKVSITQVAPPKSQNNPTISGVPNGSEYTGSNVVTCSPASFTGATAIQNYWWIGLSYSNPDNNLGTGNSLILTKEIIAKYGGGYLYCQTVASGPGGTAQASSSVYIPAWSKPVIKSGWPALTNQSDLSGSRAGDILVCSPIVWDKPVDSEVYAIYIRTGVSDTRLLANASTYVLTSDIISSYQNYEIHCSVTGTNTGGSTVATSYTGYRIKPGLKPNSVQNFKGTIGEKGTTLTWSPPVLNEATITGYIVERTDNYEPGVNGESVWRVVSSGMNTSIFVPELNPCHSSNYRVKATTGYSDSGWSNTLSANNSARCNTVLGLVSIGTPVSVPNGFNVQINGFDNTNFEWKVLLPVSPQGRYAQVSSTGLISDTSMTPGVSSRIYIFKISRATGEYVGVTTTNIVAGS